ncbi:MAG: hypothetical protein DRP59_06435 [Spirochaetes bacterium]|nr:MAG: hypothetical protein DRP59_06435 [Spirochaetota bacterium]
MKKIIVIALLVLVPLGTVIAQTSPDDPALIKAKEETAVVFDLGRMFGYLNTMVSEEKKLALSDEQMTILYSIMETLLQKERVEPDTADEMLVRIEDEILTPDQLMYTDQLAIEKLESRTPGAGGGSGGGQITNYIAGGAFNPMKDPSKNMGKDFDTFFTYLVKELGK